MNPFHILTTMEIETVFSESESCVQNFPKTLQFPFPEKYRKWVTQFKTIEISGDFILFNSVEAVNENREFATEEFWVFAGTGQGDRWLFDKKGMVFFYDHDYDEGFEPMGINFEQSVQMAFLLRDLEEMMDDQSRTSEETKVQLNTVFNQIHHQLSEKYPFQI